MFSKAYIYSFYIIEFHIKAKREKERDEQLAQMERMAQQEIDRIGQGHTMAKNYVSLKGKLSVDCVWQ